MPVSSMCAHHVRPQMSPGGRTAATVGMLSASEVTNLSSRAQVFRTSEPLARRHARRAAPGTLRVAWSRAHQLGTDCGVRGRRLGSAL
jgi:hypothetical protein